MIAPIDRTGEFLAALASHHTPPKHSPLILSPVTSPTHEFTRLAIHLTSKISDMYTFLTKCQRRYALFSTRGMGDAERDEIDSAVATFLKSAVGQIDQLKREAVAEVETEVGGSFGAHQLGVVVILNDELKRVGELSEGMRGVRVKNAIEEKAKGGVEYDVQVGKEMAEERRERERRQGVNDGGGGEDEFSMMEQEFARENATLVNELVETREMVQEAERTIVEIANLNQIFAAKVLEQAREVEVLYDLAVEATTYVERGNRELRKMRKRGPVLKYALAGLAMFLAVMLLIQEWVGRKTWGLL